MLHLTQVNKRFVEKTDHTLKEHTEIIKQLNADCYSVSNILLSYRQINELGKSGIFIEKRKEGKQGWRKFNIQEAIYLNVIKKFKEAGLTIGQLQELKKSFYKSRDFKKALYLSYVGERVIITINALGEVNYYDRLYYYLFGYKKNNSEIRVSLNLYNIISEFLDEAPEKVIDEMRVFQNILENVKKELADYPDEMGMTEEEVQKLINKLYKLSDVLWDRWIKDVERK